MLGNPAKKMPKIRDSRINVLVKNKRPTGEETVSISDTWITEKDYDNLIVLIKKDKDVREVMNAGSEEIHT